MLNPLAHLPFTLRLWKKHRLTTLVILATTALCLGANVAVFSAVYGVLLKPLNLPQPDRLVYLYNAQPGIGLDISSIAFPDYLDRREAEAFTETTTYTWRRFTLTGEGEAVSLHGVYTTHTFFDTLDVAPLMGGGWTEAEHEEGNNRVVVISHRMWQNRFGGREDIVGLEVQINRRTQTVLGVMPADFQFPHRLIDVWAPIEITPHMRSDDARGHEYLTGVARLKPGVSVEQAKVQLETIQAANAERMPDRANYWERAGFGPYIKEILLHDTAQEASLLWMVQAVAGFVLVLGLLNIMGLFVTQSIARSHELNVRAAVGANWGHLWRQLTFETLALIGLGTLLGLGLASLLIQFLNTFGFDELPRAQNIALDTPVLLVAVGLAILLSLILSTGQTLFLWRAGLARQLQAASTRTGSLHARFRHSLVVLELVFAVVLLTGAGLITRSFIALANEDPGYNPDGVVYGLMSLPGAAYGEDSERRNFLQRLETSAASLPGVAHAGLAQVLPFSGSNWGTSYEIEGIEFPEGENPHCDYRIVSPGYFEAMGLRLHQGRFLEPIDGETPATSAVVVNRYWAEKHAPDGNAIGMRLRQGGREDEEGNELWSEVVGVVENMRFAHLDETTSKEMIFWSVNDMPEGYMNLVMKAQPGVETSSLLQPMRRMLSDLDPLLPFGRTGTLQGYIDRYLASRKAAMSLVLLSGGLALVLALTGLYATLAFAVRQRRREIGIRMALGARPQAILQQFSREGGTLVLIGLVVGSGAAVAMARLIQEQLHKVNTFDPAIMATVWVLLGTCALLALAIPSIRAMRTSPAVALRDD